MSLGDTPRYTVYEFFLQTISSSAVRTLHRSSAFLPRSPRRRIIWGHPSQPHTTDKRSECFHHLRSSHTTSPCLCEFHLDFLFSIQVPTRPRYPVRSRRDLAPSSLARIPKSPQISPPPSLQVPSNCSGRSADTIYRRSCCIACLLVCFFVMTNPCVLGGTISVDR